MEKRRVENGRINSGIRPKSSRPGSRMKLRKSNNLESQTKFALEVQSVNQEVKALMKKTVMSEEEVDLFQCIREQNLIKLKKLVKNKNCNKNARDVDDPSFPTALIVATELDNADMVNLLLNAKHHRAKVNEENLYSRKAVWIAARNRNKEILELLVDGNQECQVNDVDKQTGTSPLYEAVLGNAVEAARVLVHGRADVNQRRLGEEKGPNTPLTKAIQLDNKDMVELLLNSLAKLQTKSDNGLTALHYAVAYRRYSICEILLESGAKLHTKTKSGVTSMAIAIENHNPAMVRILLDYGYNMDKKFKWKETPLQQSLSVHAENCAMTLIHYGCYLKKEHGPSYFRIAVNEKLIKVIKFLIALKPVFLNEPWVQKGEWPVSIYHRPDIYEWLKRESRKVRSLMFHCRAQIFAYLGRHPKNKIQELPLPDKLKEYLHYNEFIKDKYFIQKALDVRECPYDCPSICSVPHCPPIEVSSESENDSSDDIDSADEAGHIDINENTDETPCDHCDNDTMKKDCKALDRQTKKNKSDKGMRNSKKSKS